MAEFDDKLSQILSNPEAMAQIARLAQSLNGPPPGPPMGAAPPSAPGPSPGPPPVGNGNGPPTGAAPPGPPSGGNGPPPATPPNGNGPPPGPPTNGNGPPSGFPPDGNAPPGPGSPSAGNGPPPAPDSLPGPPPDGNAIAQFLPLLQELGGDSDARRLLYALRPYLRPHKREKVEQALRLARLFRVGKKFLSQWEG